VLGILCTQPEVRAKGLLMLAPTGKARVRMQQLAGDAGAQSRTIAQFLNQHGRYDGRIGRYYLNNRPKADAIGTVIIDEASMLTEDMLGALLDALQGVERLILVGDPSQLPPIGAGRPFVDLVAHLRPDDHERLFPRIAPGYAELTIERRQVGNDRPDLRLARWFSSSTPAPGEDDIFTDDAAHSTIRFVPWEKADDVQSTLLSVLAEELKLANPQDQRGFNRSLGANAQGEYDYFNATRGDAAGAVQHIEDWQILSPLRGMPYGVGDINRFIHERFRADLVRLAGQQRYRKIPKALGPERIVLGDKIINLSNHRRTSYPKGQGIDYLANGEVGIITGKWRRQGEGPPTSIEIEFSSQIGSRYYFAGDDFSEEGEPALELAYALTVHKAQGSQFGLVVLVLPAAHPILSRELIYTALTRHQNRVVILHQGPRPQLKDLAAPHRSETARRRTNLLADPAMVEILQPKGSVFLRDGLIHRTSDGRAVRSKSELLIAEAMLSAGVRFTYERPLVLGGKTRYPDFTIEDEVSGRTVYWEHVGMLDRPDYRAGWERKLAWYQANGVHLSGEPQAGSSVLVTTTESPQSGLDMGRVQALIREVCGG
jgi:ATP-dependent exoDNAse (exonuclease V) alpha subunit